MHFSKAVVKFRIPIIIIALVLLVPSLFGMMATRINYDMLDFPIFVFIESDSANESASFKYIIREYRKHSA